MRLADITDPLDLAAIAGATAKHNRDNGTALTDKQFMDGVFVANFLRSMRHEHVEEGADEAALKTQKRALEVERDALAAKSASLEAEVTALRAAAADPDAKT